MKGTISVNPIYQTFQVLRPYVHLRNPLVMTDSHRLYINDNKTSVHWQNRQIINATYSQQQKVLMLLCDDSRLYVLTESLQLITKIEWQSKFSVCFDLIESLGVFIQIGVSQIEILSMNMISNVKKTKFLSSMKFDIKKKCMYKCNQQTKLKWHKGYGYNLNQMLLWVWSLTDINFYSIPKLQLKSQVKNVSRKQISICSVYYNIQYKYTVTGLFNGQIKVWRLPLSRLLNQDPMLLHTFGHHVKSVDQIIKGLDDRMIISNSADLNVCLWSLETFQMLRVYNFVSQYSKIYLYDCFSAFAVYEAQLGRLTFGKVMDFITEINSGVMFHCKKMSEISLNQASDIQGLQLTLGSNLGFQIKTKCFEQKDLNKINIEYIYPPLKAKGILQIISSPYQDNQYFMLVENGQLFRLRLQNKSGRIQKAYNIQKTQDVEMHSLNQAPTNIMFLKLVPPEYDSEIIDNTLQKKQTKQDLDLQSQYKRLRLMAIGCDKGTIVFLNTDSMDRIYTRVTYHRQSITNMQSMYVPERKVFYMASTCVQNYLKIVKFEHQKVQCILSILCGNSLASIKCFEDRLSLIFEKGYFQIFQISQKDQVFSVKNEQANDHEQDIVTMDYDPKHKLLLTASLQNKIKIWTKNKVLIYEVLLDEGLKYAVWAENMEILVQHNLKILYLRNTGFKLKLGQLQNIDEQFLQMQKDNIITVRDMVIQVKEKMKFHKSDQQIRSNLRQNNSFKQSPVKKSKKNIMDLSLPSPKNVNLMQGFKNQRNRITSKAKSKTKKQQRKKSYSMHLQQEKRPIIPQQDIEAMHRHVNHMDAIKKKVNESILPKINNKGQDSMFDNFMKSKLINKKILTRRDITLNRIIMKNIIKDHFGNDQDVLGSLKLDF